MKSYIVILLFLSISVVLPTSCEKYLDKAPEQGISDEEVFSKYSNFRKFFDAVYVGQQLYSGSWRDYNISTGFTLKFYYSPQKYSWEALSDAADMARSAEGQIIKGGSVIGFVDKFTYDGARCPILRSMFLDIRKSNMALEKIKMLKDASESEINDLIGQALFVRAFCHWTLFKIWGPMPYIKKVLGPDDQWDIPRLSKHETCIKIAQDLDTAYHYFQLAGKIRRDPGPGQPGHLADPDQRAPNGVAAKALKSRVLLYAASPLNNELGATDWQNAAAASWEAIQIALANYYELLTPLSERSKNYFGTKYSNEQIWGWNGGVLTWGHTYYQGIMNGVFCANKTNASGVCPTQNFVDKYETGFGEPLNTQADRDAAIAAGHYNEQNPYVNRDPRLATDIITNQSSCIGWSNGKAQIWYQVSGTKITYSELLDQSYLGTTKTGYYQRKYWADNSQKNQISVQLTDPVIRLAELYLNYAEASNEAYGPTAKGVPGATLSAVDAINVIRTRAGQVNVLPKYTTDKDTFRNRVKNERNVELSWEGFYYFDIRRWMEAPELYSSRLMGVDIEKLSPNPDPVTYPIGFKYTRYALSSDRQIAWKDAMYYLPFNTTDNFKMKNFVPNVVW